MLATWLLWTILATESPTVISISLLGGPEVGAPEVNMARQAATHMFTRIGLILDWCDRPANCKDWRNRIIVTLQPDAPATLSKVAMADASLTGSQRIRIFLSRLPRRERALNPQVLAYVLVHEVTHLLQDRRHHSDTGVMKPRWTPSDLKLMASRRLDFAAEDIELIQQGISRRPR